MYIKAVNIIILLECIENTCVLEPLRKKPCVGALRGSLAWEPCAEPCAGALRRRRREILCCLALAHGPCAWALRMALRMPLRACATLFDTLARDLAQALRELVYVHRYACGNTAVSYTHNAHIRCARTSCLHRSLREFLADAPCTSNLALAMRNMSAQILVRGRL